MPPEPTDNGPTILPPPVDPVAEADAASPTEPTESAGIVTDVPEPEQEEAEEPVIPDLAKGILIAQNHGDLTFKPGLRIQPRYMYDEGSSNNDFFIRRFRLKGSGSAYGVAKYGVELKIDNEGRYGVSPSARAENAWLDFPIDDCDLCYLRAGLYDIPFSRDALTSDSKLLFMDRTLIKEQLTAVGMADNTFGLMLHSRPYCGRFEYAFGIFDSDVYERNVGFGVAPIPRESDELMPAGRFVVSLLDPQPVPDQYADYLESYLGKGQRLDIGVNFAHLGGVTDTAVSATDDFDLTAWGIDLFANSGPWTFQTEYDQIVENIALAADVTAEGWYAQGGYIFHYDDPCIAEFAVRYEQLNPTPIFGDDTFEWTRVGFNFYIREHNLKVQTDYCFRSGNDLVAALPGGLGFFDEDVFEVQLQLDF
jgi:phosphate-selective porin